MNLYVALLRGVNVGGRNRLPMRELVSILESVGCRNVHTYVQSGNAVFESATPDRQSLSREVAGEIRERLGFAPHVLLLSLADLERAIADNPFPEGEADPAHLQLGFLESEPLHPDTNKLNSLRSATERFHLTGGVLYLYAPDGIGTSKLAATAEKLLCVPMTSRNWTTVTRLWDMARALARGRDVGDR